MMRSVPKDLDTAQVRKLLAKMRSIEGIGPRVDAASRCFLGYPYKSDPLIGGVDQAEVFTADLGGFDCVTFVETTLALARAVTPADFIDSLRRIRYLKGVVQWNSRHHYMTQWIRENVEAGIVKNMTQGSGLVERTRRLDAVEGLPVTTVRVSSIPKRLVITQAGKLQSGDLAFFASTRKNHDVFHCGILIKGEGIWLRHAARSRRCVLDQPLSEFLSANRMSGVIVVRPKETGHVR